MLTLGRYDSGVLGVLVGGPRAYQDRFFRGFKSHRVHMLAGTFSFMKQLIGGKRESAS